MVRKLVIFAVAGAMVAVRAPAADDQQSPDTARPYLTQLNHEVQALYIDVQRSIARIQLPPPLIARELADKNNPANKWNNLDPAVKEQIEQIARANGQVKIEVRAVPSTQPTTGPVATPDERATAASPWKITRTPSGEMILEPKGGAALEIRAGGQREDNGQIKPAEHPQIGFQPAEDFAPNSTGLLIDDRGHVLVPQYVDRQSLGEKGTVKLAIGGQQVQATFVGSDRQTMISIFRLAKPMGQPARLSAEPPAIGSLAMLVNPANGGGRLVVWTGSIQDTGVLATVDGGIAGFVRPGQFFSARAAAPVVEQLIATGRVRRATLGIRLTEVRAEDPARRVQAQLGNRPALRVDQVDPGSLADAVGVQKGDMICALGDEPVGDPPTFAAFLSAKVGRTPLMVLRDNRILMLTLDLPNPKGNP